MMVFVVNNGESSTITHDPSGEWWWKSWFIMIIIMVNNGEHSGLYGFTMVNNGLWNINEWWLIN